MEIGFKLQIGAAQGFSGRLNEIHLLLQLCSTIRAGIGEAVSAQGECKHTTGHTHLQSQQQLQAAIGSSSAVDS